MDNANKKDVLLIARNDSDKEKIYLILNEIFPNENMNVPNPYYGGSEGFQIVYECLIYLVIALPIVFNLLF
jgi:protein-tyrosine phosphatase|tara:strand:+ start:1025 stop:1237 length:213 start_codon:yes stop_codon:yes gene_type:complete